MKAKKKVARKNRHTRVFKVHNTWDVVTLWASTNKFIGALSLDTADALGLRRSGTYRITVSEVQP